MIYLFTGNSRVLIDEAVLKWKNQFVEKYWDFNLLHIKELASTDINFLSENLFWASFLNETKLIIIDLNTDLKENFTNFFLNSYSRIPENNMVLLNYPSPDKRLKFYKEIVKVSEIKEFNIEWESDINNLILKKYKWKISPRASNLLIKYKWNKLDKVINEIEKLLITIPFIEEKDILDFINPELEESIFQIIDDILWLKSNDAIEKIENLIQEINIYAFYNNLLANIRTSLFIIKLKKEWKNPNEINTILDLWNKKFLINKNYKITYQKLKELYISLIDIDKKMKTWYLLWAEDSDFLYEIEANLIKLVK